MGIDLYGIIGHSYTKKQLLELPTKMQNWKEIYDYYSQRSDHSSYDPIWLGARTEEDLERVWQYQEGKSAEEFSFDDLEELEPEISCNFGELYVYRKSFIVVHNWEKYKNLRDSFRGTTILWINRMLAQQLGASEVLYCPDSGYPTQVIGDLTALGWDYNSIKNYGLQEFGTPPRGGEEGRKYSFFIDYIHEPLEDLTQWEGDSPYWYYDKKKGYQWVNPPK